MSKIGEEIQTGTVVIGGGFAGLSTAYHLALSDQREVVVIERDAAAGRHASGRNAGMIRQTVSDPVLAHLARLGRDALAAAAGSWKGVGFRSEGSLLVAESWDRAKLEAIEAASRREGIPVRWLEPRDASKRVPVLEGARFSLALFCPTDGKISIDALLAGFLKEISRRGVKVFYGHPLESVERVGDRFLVSAGGRLFVARRVVNAAGAWAADVGRRAQGTPVPLKAYRRHLYFTAPIAAPPGWPFVWDVSHDLYFRPVEGGALLMSPCDKELFTLEDPSVKAEGLDPEMKAAMKKKLAHFSERLGRVRLASGKAGLRTMAPDGRFVVGEDPALPGFFWVAGLGGHGVTTCFSVGRVAADLVMGRKVNPAVKKALSPARFAGAKAKKGAYAAA